MKLILTGLLILAGQILYPQVITEQLSHLYRIDQLPIYFEKSHTGQFSSYDRTGGNDDGFNGTYSFIRKEGSDLVIAEMEGSGVITRIWTPTPSEDTIQFFMDGEEFPRVSIPFIDLFSGKQFPFKAPLCGHEVGGYYCYIPIPYRRSCKVVFKGTMLFYQLQYRSFPGHTDMVSFDPDWPA